ncbi:DNA polymerase-3 subunit gamma/tau [Roseiarcus fermentans]|uniref:DNA polymerase III subunit gamma/tau n=1 Tax=Roseiarcus fermentans TaxID=1473586 RepID=A0A366FCJ9_9HYPH|nr:DNA polymerase III subunit gamma/tau [Roseiarcus fermentans]RBP11435.1 DNA polymerase-3 subunit gamma/tau [Roseiarcus fermentans]
MSDSLFPAAPEAAPAPYRVLARKYRPQRFDDLIGQEPMVRTLANSFASGRIHQAYIFTGVRGTGKTTTARILARAFNYSVPGKVERPSVDMPELGVHCQAIMDSRHVDVIEMDAASHTGIDDVREIIENARYWPVSARTKVYIIDEVHMLSKQAFNGLLKTLEEPPEHVKFLFATTEIDKVPITVRSRCIRFDLKRIEPGLMVEHLARIAAAEGVAAETAALQLIARVAEGSVRDALSLLDQGIAYGGGQGVTAVAVRDMLGLSDKGEIVDLFERTMKGEIAAALDLMRGLYRAGADPADILIEVAEFCHTVTRIKIAPDAPDDAAIGEAERARARDFAGKLGMGALTRAWAILIKGVDDVKDSPRPLASAEMALIRLAFATDLPSPEDALRKLADSAEGAPRHVPQPTPTGGPRAALVAVPASQAAPPSHAPPAPAPAVKLARFEDVVALARARRDIQLVHALERDIRLDRFEPGRITVSLVEGASPALAQTLAKRLADWTGERWMVALVQGATAPTLRETAARREADRTSDAAQNPVVRKVLERFKGARIVEVRAADSAPPPPPPEPLADDDVGYADSEAPFDDDL